MAYDPIKKSRELEALLFIYGEAMPVSKIKKLLKLDSQEFALVQKNLDDRLKAGGLVLISNDDSLQLSTGPEHALLVNEVVKAELNEDLTPPALETLAIVLYAGPITRARIDYIRGVNSTFILRSLLIRGLIARNLDPEKQNTYIYSASTELIRHLGLNEIGSLPDFAKYREILGQMKIPADTPPPDSDPSA